MQIDTETEHPTTIDAPETAPETTPQASGRPPRTGLTVIITMLASLALVVAGLGAGWLYWGQDSPSDTQAVPTTTADQASQPPADQSSASEEPVAAVANALLPTVVQIETSMGLGSGVVYDANGLILTAAHVVGNESQVTVRLSDGDQVSGEVVGTDQNSDIAVIKIDRDGLAAAPLAVDTPVEVGQTAVALGSPYGLEQTVTSGVVSATDRAMMGSDGLIRTAIQTDAPINPGNSGGPLANLDGQVIGINDAIFSRSGGNEGVGFAVPITIAKQVADQLVAGEPIQTAFLGISGTTPVQGEAGVLITGVVQGSPADDAGLTIGDLITSLDEDRVESMVDLAAKIRAHQPGDEVTIHLTRGGDNTSVTLKLGTNE